jgi:hypothetical protein
MATSQRCTPMYLKIILLLTLCSQLNAFTLPSKHATTTTNHEQLRVAPDTAATMFSTQHGPHHQYASTSTRLLASTLSGGGGSEKEEVALVTKVQSFVEKNFFLLGMVVAVSCARLFPAVRVRMSGDNRMPYVLCLTTTPFLYHV